MTAIPLRHSYDCPDRSVACGRRARHRRPGDIAARLVATFGLWRRRSRERAELAALDERMLADIGITRAEARYRAGKPFWRE